MANNQLSENNLRELQKIPFFTTQKHENLCILNMPLKFVATSCYKYWDWGCIEIQSATFFRWRLSARFNELIVSKEKNGRMVQSSILFSLLALYVY